MYVHLRDVPTARCFEHPDTGKVFCKWVSDSNGTCLCQAIDDDEYWSGEPWLTVLLLPET